MPAASSPTNAISSDLFLQGCGLPAAWADAAQWRILETGFGLGSNFLAAWHAWRADPHRPRLLHYVAASGQAPDLQDLVRAAQHSPEQLALSQVLAAQAWGLLPGLHRLGFEDGQVLLTLCIGDAQGMLRKELWRVDAVFASSTTQLEASDGPKALARCCERGARLVAPKRSAPVQGALIQAGFQIAPPATESGNAGPLHARFEPHWEPRIRATRNATTQPTQAARCAVIGAGIAGAAVAASLARRGWTVDVLDAADEAAAGASGLPVGLFAPHISPDDNVFSRVSRAGVRATLEQGMRLLQAGTDWQPGGVLERRPGDAPGLPAGWEEGAGADWSHAADAARLHAAGLPAQSPACWHARAGWVRPQKLAGKLLDMPGIGLHTHSRVAQLSRKPTSGGEVWQLHGAQGALLAEAELVVLAAGPACNALVQSLGLAALPLDVVRGQLSWGQQDASLALPPFPVNGKGALVGNVPMAGERLAWHAGSTFERGRAELPLDPQEQRAAHEVNFANLQQLLPQAAQQLAGNFADGTPGLKSWTGVRCTSPDRLPIVGPLDSERLPGLWVSTAMGARGLTRAILCGELLAARLHGEPLPLEARLARAMGTERLEPGLR